MFCPSCGKEVDSNQQFCPECGMEIISIPKIIPQSDVIPSVPPKSQKSVVSIKKKRKVGLIIAILIISGLGIFFIVTFVNWGSAEGEQDYYYYNNSPASIEALYFDVGTCNLDIRYNESVTAPIVKIHVDYHVSGGFIQGKTIYQIFDIIWDNTSERKSFTLHRKGPPNWIIFDNTNILVTLRTDVVYDFDVDVSTGSTNMIIPDGVTIKKLDLSTSTGSVEIEAGTNVIFQDTVIIGTSTGSADFFAEGVIFNSGISATASTGEIELNLTNCELNGDIYGHASTGSFEFYSFNNLYQSEVDWNITVSTGSIYIEIYQYIFMLNDVNAGIQASTGTIVIDYNGNDTISGARFDSTVSTGGNFYTNNGGFTEIGSVFESLGYNTAVNKYTFMLEVSTGNIMVYGKSQ